MLRRCCIDLRFKVGDIIEVAKYWDQGEDMWRSGVIMITEIGPPGPYNSKGSYGTKRMSGDIHWISTSVEFLDKMNYLIWIGNIEDNPALKVLYGAG